jgi:hypothetical protein
LALCCALVVLFSLLLLAVRPWYLSWGATASEAAATLPGDELLHARTQSTRAITIAAPAEKVWPWLLQLGQDRGGFYSYELLENLVGTDMDYVDVLRPELQHWKLGDKLWMYPPDKLAGAGHAVLQRFDPERALVFGTRQIGTPVGQPTDGTWAFVLQPIDAASTRLFVRGRAAAARSAAQRAFDRLVFEPAHFVMERKMMEGIKARAEGGAGSPATDVLEVVLFAVCFALFVGAAVRVVRWPTARRSLTVILAAGLAFQLLTFVQPPWIVGFLIVVSLVVLFELAHYA